MTIMNSRHQIINVWANLMPLNQSSFNTNWNFMTLYNVTVSGVTERATFILPFIHSHLLAQFDHHWIFFVFKLIKFFILFRFSILLVFEHEEMLFIHLIILTEYCILMQKNAFIFIWTKIDSKCQYKFIFLYWIRTCFIIHSSLNSVKHWSHWEYTGEGWQICLFTVFFLNTHLYERQWF